MKEVYTTRQLEEVLPHLSGRYQNWQRMNLVAPTVTQHKPCRRGNRHTLGDLVAVVVVHHLFELGLGSPQIRAALRSEETFEGTGYEEFDKDEPGRQLSSLFRAVGFNWVVLVHKGFDGDATLRICRDSPNDNITAKGNCSVTVLSVAGIHSELTRRLSEVVRAGKGPQAVSQE